MRSRSRQVELNRLQTYYSENKDSSQASYLL